MVDARRVAFGLFMIMLDNTIVNVARPSIQRDGGGRVMLPQRSPEGQ